MTIGTINALIIVAILLPIAMAHFLWATGSIWPFKNRHNLVGTLIGSEMSVYTSLSGLLTGFVAFLILCAAVLPLIAVTSSKPDWLDTLLTLGVYVEGFVFLTRGVAGYTPWAQRAAPLEPFKTYNRRYYNPLCLVLGALCFTILATN